MLAARGICMGRTFDRQIIRFGCSGRPDDFAWIGIDQLRHLGSGQLDGLFGIPAVSMAARGRIAELLVQPGHHFIRSEEHTSELQSLMRISYAVFCLKKKKNKRRKDSN